MKTIQDVQIWDNGQVKVAKVLNAFAVSLNFNQNASFKYSLLSLNDDGSLSNEISGGGLFMPTEQYLQWDQDEFAWDFIASSLNLVITGDYVAPQPPIVEEPVIETPVEESAIESPSNSL